MYAKESKDIPSKAYFIKYGYEQNQKIGYLDKDILSKDITVKSTNKSCRYQENPSGNLVADAYLYTAKNIENQQGENVSFSLVSDAALFGGLKKGSVTTGDCFNLLENAYIQNKILTNPLLVVYLSGEDLLNIFEMSTTVPKTMSQLNFSESGLLYTYNPNRFLFSKVIKLETYDEKDRLDKAKLYSVAMDYFTAKQIQTIKANSYGLIDVVLKNQNGTEIKDLTQVMIKQKNRNIESWESIAIYLKSLSPEQEAKNEGSNVIKKYQKPQGKIEIYNSKNINDIFKNPSSYMKLFFGIFAISAMLIIFLLFLIRRLILQIVHYREQFYEIKNKIDK